MSDLVASSMLRPPFYPSYVLVAIFCQLVYCIALLLLPPLFYLPGASSCNFSQILVVSGSFLFIFLLSLGRPSRRFLVVSSNSSCFFLLAFSVALLFKLQLVCCCCLPDYLLMSEGADIWKNCALNETRIILKQYTINK